MNSIKFVIVFVIGIVSGFIVTSHAEIVHLVGVTEHVGKYVDYSVTERQQIEARNKMYEATIQQFVVDMKKYK